MKKYIYSVLLIALALTISACSSVNSASRAQAQSTPNMVDDKRIITDSDLDSFAYIASINEAFVSGNLLKIQVQLVNRSEAFRQVNYQITWLDQSGMQVSTPNNGWTTISIEPGESKYISAVAPNPNARDFNLKLLGTVR